MYESQPSDESVPAAPVSAFQDGEDIFSTSLNMSDADRRRYLQGDLFCIPVLPPLVPISLLNTILMLS